MNTTKRLFFFLVCSFLLLACSFAAATSTLVPTTVPQVVTVLVTAEPPGPTTTAADTGQLQELQPCTLVTVAEAEAILGEAAAAPQEVNGACSFSNARDALYLVSVAAAQEAQTEGILQGQTFLLGIAGAPLDQTKLDQLQALAKAQDYQSFFTGLVTVAQGAPTVQARLVDGVGDVGYWAWLEAQSRRQGALVVARGQTVVNVNLVVADSQAEQTMLEAAKSLAEAAFSRLPARFTLPLPTATPALAQEVVPVPTSPPSEPASPTPQPTSIPLSPTPIPLSPTSIPPSPTPPPPAPPVIQLFTADPPAINAGGSSTLKWEVAGADSVEIDQGIGPVDLSGSHQVSPADTTTYRLTAHNAGGAATQEIMVQVNKPVQATLSNQLSATAYLDSNGEPRIYTFVASNDGRLFVNYWDGAQWHWADQGVSAGGKSDSVAAINYQEGASPRIYTFTTGNSHLYVNYWDGGQWRWADQGQPQNASASSVPGVITFREAGSQRLYAFVTYSGHLYVNYWDGGQWRWADQGSPTSHALSAPGVITYLEENKQRIYAFVSASTGTLSVNYWDGGQWHWATQGSPQNTTVSSAPGVIAYLEGGKPRIYAFVRGNDNRLHVNYWDGGQWRWADQGQPANANVAGAPGVITFQERNSQRIYAFVRGSDNHLHVNYWDGGQWHWADQGQPANANVISIPSVITYREAGMQRIYAFVMGSDGHLHVNYWDGKQWRWVDQGAP